MVPAFYVPASEKRSLGEGPNAWGMRQFGEESGAHGASYVTAVTWPEGGLAPIGNTAYIARGACSEAKGLTPKSFQSRRVV